MTLRGHVPGRTYRALREAPDTPAIADSAREEFVRRYPEVKLQRLVVVIAAFNEAANIGAVLDEVPAQIADVPVSRLVIDDGSTDGTSEAARRHGALVCTLSANRGHGVALRLGYRIAREAGAGLIATLDGDGQWDPADLPAMVRMIEEDRADVIIPQGITQCPVQMKPDWLSRELGVPVIEGIGAPIKMAAMLASLGLRQSRVRWQKEGSQPR